MSPSLQHLARLPSHSPMSSTTMSTTTSTTTAGTTSISSSSTSSAPLVSTVSPSIDQMDSGDEDAHPPEKHSYSCKRCRRLKKKCSRTKPECQNCNKSGENCEYVPRAPRRKKAEILQNMDYDEEAQEPSAPQQSLPSLSTTTNSNNQLPSVSELTGSRRQDGSVFSAFDHQRPSLPPLRSLASSLASRRPFFPPTSHVQRDHDHSHRHHSSVNTDTSTSTSTSSNASTINGRTRLPVANLQHAYLSNALHAPSSAFCLGQTSSPLSHDLLTRCVDRFFGDFGKTYPFLDHAKFKEKYNPLAHSFQEGKHIEVNMAVFLGYLSLSKMRQVPGDIQLKETLRVRALADVSIFIQDESVDTLKRLLYYAMYTLMEHSAEASWYVCGMVTRMVLSLGINRITPRVGYTDEYTIAEEEDKIRIFWSCYNFDRVTSATLGRPESLIDSDIDVPVLSSRADEDQDLVELLKAVSRLRTVEGKIMREVHSISVSTNGKCQPRTSDEQHAVLQKLRLEVEAWYNATSVITRVDRKVSLMPCTTSWYSSTYYYLLLLLYRPSFLCPTPSKETLILLGRCCLEAASFTHNLHIHHPLPMHWVQLNRIIIHCTTLVFCLTHSCVDLLETKTEVNIYIQLLEHFAGEWPVCAQILDVFHKINSKVHDLRLNRELVINAENGIGPLFRALSSEYCDVLVRNGYEMKFDDPAIQGIRSI